MKKTKMTMKKMNKSTTTTRMSRERRRPPRGSTTRSSPPNPTSTSTERTTRRRTRRSSRAGSQTTSTRTSQPATPATSSIVDRDEEDSFIASELVHTGAGTYGVGEEDGKEGDVHDVQGRRVGWWQPKVGEEREATDARVWREDLGMVPNEEDDPGGMGTIWRTKRPFRTDREIPRRTSRKTRGVATTTRATALRRVEHGMDHR